MVLFRKSAAGIFVVFFIAVGASSPVHAQWSQIAHHLFSPTGTGAITYHDGLLWVACDSTYFSTDTGRSWRSFPFPDPAFNGIIYDLKFFDRSIGLAAFPGGTYLTNDQGRTWKLVKAGIPYSVAFGLTPQIMAIAEDSPFGVSISTDGGLSWKSKRLGETVFKVLGRKDGSFLCYAGTPAQPLNMKLPHGGYIYSTTDNGANWLRRAGNNPNFDCFDFDVDSCDANRIYLANANAAGGADSLSNIYVSSDGGDSWQIKLPFITPYFVGSLAISSNAVYAQSCGSGIDRLGGIYRSKDYGRTWKNIEGPNNEQNTRFICAIDDNLLFAADDFGNVWRTLNSGGDSIQGFKAASYTFSPEGTATFDTLTSCTLTASDTILLIRHCDPPAIESMTVTGADSINFLVASGPGSDTIVLLFTAGSKQSYAAALRLRLADGTIDTIALAGFGRPTPPISLKPIAIRNDTIGGTVDLELQPDSLANGGDLTFAVSYDTAMLIYEGAFGTAAAPTDATIFLTPGYARIRLDSGQIDWKQDVLAHLVFRIFPGRDSCTVVRIDSMSLAERGITCQSSSGEQLMQICTNGGCGSGTISEFVRYGLAPRLTVSPNPSRGTVMVTSDRDIGNATFTIYDRLGVVRAIISTTISSSRPAFLDCNRLESGVYSIRVASASYSTALEMVRVR